MNTDGHYRFSLDWDLTRWQQPVVFNLELMKLVTHHKRNRNLVKMLHKYDFERYSKIIVRKDYEDDDYPPEIFNNPKTEAGGLVFSAEGYLPMDTSIEQLPADTSIYQQMGRYYSTGVVQNQRFKTLLNTDHFRLSLDGKTTWSGWDKQIEHSNLSIVQNFIVHDLNITAIDGALDALLELQASTNPIGGRVGFKFPLQVNNDAELLEWSQLRTLKLFSAFYVSTLLEDITFTKIIEQGSTRIVYNIPAPALTTTALERIFKQAVFLGDYNSQLLLNIVEEELKNPIEKQLVVLLNQFFGHLRVPSTKEPLTFFNYSKYYSGWLKVDLREIFEYVRQTAPALFKLFYECSQVVLIDDNFESRYIWKWN